MEELWEKTKLGWIHIKEEEGKIVECNFTKQQEGENSKSVLLQKAVLELEEYFEGKRQTFSVPVSPKGTAFQRSVWEELQKIPYGKTISYGELAEKIGKKKAARAVGMANHNNPICIFIPCHRVIGKNGKLVGYAEGVDKKEYLLNLEKENVKKS